MAGRHRCLPGMLVFWRRKRRAPKLRHFQKARLPLIRFSKSGPGDSQGHQAHGSFIKLGLSSGAPGRSLAHRFRCALTDRVLLKPQIVLQNVRLELSFVVPVLLRSINPVPRVPWDQTTASAAGNGFLPSSPSSARRHEASLGPVGSALDVAPGSGHRGDAPIVARPLRRTDFRSGIRDLAGKLYCLSGNPGSPATPLFSAFASLEIIGFSGLWESSRRNSHPGWGPEL